MKNVNTSFAGLFGREFTNGHVVRSVEVPELQRDYAQGRSDLKTSKVRADFLDAIARAVRGEQALALDFIYGELTDAGALQPVDGQQRLTTLFLLHWYLAARTGRLPSTSGWTRFTYRTRPGARRFCERLCAQAADFSVMTPSQWVVDQPWCPPNWREDPTISSMLVVLDAMHERFKVIDCEAAWLRVVEAPVPMITFDVLPVRDLGPADELYIRMNSRGKPLTEFEVFKARFEHVLEAIDPGFPGRFAERADNQWADVFWPYRGGDEVIDEELLRYLRFTTELLAWREGQHPPQAGDMEALAAKVFSPTNPWAASRAERMFRVTDTWIGADVRQEFAALFTLAAVPSPAADAPLKLFPSSSSPSVDLFGACCKSYDPSRTERAFGWPEALLLHAVLVDRLAPVAAHDRQSRLRIVRNLVEGSPNELRAASMPILSQQVETIMADGLPSVVSGFNGNAVSDERAKLAFVGAHPRLAECMRRLEDHPLLRGSLVAFELDPEVFERRATAFAQLMEAGPGSQARLPALTAALLATGNPMLRDSKFHVLGSSSVLQSWRERLTGHSRAAMAATRAALGAVLDVVAARGQASIETALSESTQQWLAECRNQNAFNWRWYLAAYPAMRSGVSGRYASSEGKPGFTMCMLDKRFMHSHYRDPWLHAMRLESGAASLIEDKMFTGSEYLQRWLPMTRSEINFLACAEGIRVQIPESRIADSELLARLAELQLKQVNPRQWIREIRRSSADLTVDNEDRVQAGAALMRTLAGWGY